MRWSTAEISEEEVDALSRYIGKSRIVAGLLIHLGVGDAEDAQHFIQPRLAVLEDPFRLTNIDLVVERLRRALETGEDVLIFGDYDVDGVTSTTFLTAILRLFGGRPRFVVPRRLEEGYGLSRVALDRALDDGVPGLLVAVDCGTNSVEEISYLRERGVDVVIIDHHVCKDEDAIPDHSTLVNPHVFDEGDEPWSDLCSVGLVFKVVHALVKQLRREGDETALAVKLKDYLDLVAMGTVADLVPLRGENRILAKAGLRRLKDSCRPGIKALFEASGMQAGEEVSTYDISFKLGPRINASGRLADATLPIELLLSSDRDFCTRTAGMLNAFNCERREIEKNIFIEAERIVETRLAGAAGYVCFNPDWHPGVVGIVASRIVQKYHRPCIVLGAEGGVAKGSGRSILGVDLVEVLGHCTDLLERWGGHPMAVGISVQTGRLEALQEAFSSAVKDSVNGRLPEKAIDIALWIDRSDLGADLLEDLDSLHPFGQGNPEPTFGLRGVTLGIPPQIFGKEGEHFRFSIPTTPGQRISAVAWKLAERLPPANQPVDLAVRMQWNSYNGRRSPQAVLVDWRPGGGGDGES